MIIASQYIYTNILYTCKNICNFIKKEDIYSIKN